MHDEHDAHQALLQNLLETCAALEADPGRLPELQSSLACTAHDLERELGLHLDEEERDVFPVIERLTSEAERSEMIEELRRRRA